MTVLVAVPEGREGPQALHAGAGEARMLDTDLVVVNLTLRAIDVSGLPRTSRSRSSNAPGPRTAIRRTPCSRRSTSVRTSGGSSSA